MQSRPIWKLPNLNIQVLEQKQTSDFWPWIRTEFFNFHLTDLRY